MTLFSVVVPVYNSRNSLELLYNRIKSVFEQTICQPFELILVDDASTDDSFLIMEKLRQADRRIKIVQLARNFGQHKALMCGLSYVKGDFVITIDDDLQHPPEEIIKLTDYIQKHPEIDVVIGNYINKKHNTFRNLGSNAMHLLSRIMLGSDKNIKLTSFRLMRRYVADALLKNTERSPRIGHLLLATTNRIANTPVLHAQREYGKSGYSYRRLIHDFISNIINNSDLPLNLVGRLGIISFFISLALLAYYLIKYFVTGYGVSGWITQVLLLVAFSGLILFSLGIIGKYLIRIMGESKKAPIYVIRTESVDSNSDRETT
ncbi:MAG: glycosyltransferase family 2 protein [Lachnospiraceae bacterium]|jgi:dolichol-phosphate mannosyltransferase/undecaprenyl-phosphate 4-deoxy-4-formamido-L-arabinose transferase|nr:glycosyltransferase family 2 protein [Lachnospiraceae bacterium]